VSTPDEIVSLQKNLSGIYVNESIRSYIANITRATREHSAFELGASPRATLALFRATRASAGISGRNYVNPEDVKKLVKPVLAHRLLLSTNSRLRGRGPEEVIDEVLQTIPVPVADD
jgi:MoxR-like ATPase